MNRYWLGFGLVILLVQAIGAVPVPKGVESEDSMEWSKPSNGLQARITLVEKEKFNDTRMLVPYLELMNAGNLANALKVRCDSGHVKFELLDVDGKRIDGSSLPRSGPYADPGTISLPHDSQIRIGMHCSNWGVPKGASAMISVDTGAWIFQAKDKGKFFLRATIQGAKEKTGQLWFGNIETPLVKVTWKEP